MPRIGYAVEMDRAARALRRRRIALRVAGGARLSEAAREEGVSVPTASLACAEFGVAANRDRAVRPFVVLARLFDPAASFGAIGRELGLCPKAVAQVHRRAVAAGVPGLPPRADGRRSA